MLYDAYEMQRSLLAGASTLANIGAGWMQNPANPFAYARMGPIVASALDVFAHASAPRGKPDFGLETPWSRAGRSRSTRRSCSASRSASSSISAARASKGGPRLLIVAPMSGHYATLLRGTVERMLPGHEVYITDWRDAKLVPLDEGRFDLDDYIDYLIEFLEHIGPGAHMLAVCQPSVPCYAAAALMSADGNPGAAADPDHDGRPDRHPQGADRGQHRRHPAAARWFQQNVIASVPYTYPGAGRPVYPGFLQLAGFMAMNLGEHLTGHWEMFKHLVQGDGESAEASKDFYDEYRSVCDMTAEFYLQTVDVVFQRHLLPKGELMHRGRRVDPAAITRHRPARHRGRARRYFRHRPDQGGARHLDRACRASMKQYHLAKGVGHYGIFNGSKWRDRIAPVVEEWIARHDLASRRRPGPSSSGAPLAPAFAGEP